MTRFLIPCAVALLSGCVFHIKENNLVIPRPGPAITASATEDGAWTISPLEVQAPDGALLRGAWFKRPGARATVLYFGGNGFVLSAHHKYVLAGYAGLPVDVICVDHRGYGASTGVAGIDALVGDGAHVYDAVRRAVSPSHPVIVHGHSLGSFVAGDVARRRRLDGLVLESSATTAEDWVKGFADRSRWVRRVVPDPPLAGKGNASAMDTLDEPVLIVVGAADTATAPWMSEALFERAAVPEHLKELLVVPGAGHMNAARHPSFGPAFERLLERARRASGGTAPAAAGAAAPTG